VHQDTLPLGDRIREERERLGWSQQAAANAVGVRREMWAKYEAGSEPGAKVLSGMVAAGMDVVYVLTGQRTQSIAPAFLSPSDRELLNDFHAAPAKVQVGVKTTLEAFTPATGRAEHKAAA